MKITLKHLKKRWDKDHLADIKMAGRLVIGSDRIFGLSDAVTTFIDAVWSEDHDGAVEKRDSNKERFKHIFISEMCKVAVEEYDTVCHLLGLSKILLLSVQGDVDFFLKSEELLKSLNVPIE